MIKIFLARIYYMWGSLHRNFGNYRGLSREHHSAVKRFGQAYDLDPNLREAKLDRAIILYREMGQFDEAQTDLNALLANDPTYGPALLNRAMLFQQQGHYLGALADLDAYLELPDEDEEYRRLAIRTADLLRELIKELDSEEE